LGIANLLPWWNILILGAQLTGGCNTYTLFSNPGNICVLPDHLHTIWSLSESDANYPLRLSLIKAKE
jgi:hypothetical protein